MATSSSCRGLSGIRSMAAMPPIGDRITCGRPEAARLGDVAEFMRPHAQEDEQDENNRFNGDGKAPGLVDRSADPGEEDQDGGVEPDPGTRVIAENKESIHKSNIGRFSLFSRGRHSRGRSFFDPYQPPTAFS